MNVSFYQQDEYPMIKSWWEKVGQVAPPEEMMPPTTLMMSTDEKVPLVSVSLFVTNTPLIWVDNLISNPDAKKSEVKNAVEVLNEIIAAYARKMGKKKLFCMSLNKKTSRRYRQLGFMPTANVETFVREI